MPSVGAIRETFINATEGHMIGEGECSSLFSDKPGELFRSCRSEYGRCVSSIYRDQKDGPPIRCGWVFQGLDKYEDTGEPYLREVWVQLLEKPDTVTRTVHPIALPCAA